MPLRRPPGRILGIRANYPGTADCALPARQRLFLKPPAALATGEHALRLRSPGRRTDVEVELVVVIGRIADRLTDPVAALAHVAGYCVGLDLGLHGAEDRGLRKGLDGHAVLGPRMVAAAEFSGAPDLEIVLEVNGVIRQSGRTGQLCTGVGELLCLASEYFVLGPGDLLYTGSPPGAGAIAPGDRLRAGITGIGELSLEVTGPG